MVVITRGTTGQAEFDPAIVPNPSCPGGYLIGEGDWRIRIPSVAQVAESFNGIYSGQPGWNITKEGIVTVPPDAAVGTYAGDYGNGLGMCEEGFDAHETYFYVFEVQCVKIRITKQAVPQE